MQPLTVFEQIKILPKDVLVNHIQIHDHFLFNRICDMACNVEHLF